MKHRLLVTVICFFIVSTLQSAWAYSAFWNIDGWDVAQLKESGITIARWKHDQIGEFPAANWIEITYDGAMGREALMTLELYTADRSSVNRFRAVRNKDDKGPLKLLFAVPEEYDDFSCVQIVVPEALSAGLEHEKASGTIGNPGWGGFTLHLSRIVKLAGPKPEPGPGGEFEEIPREAGNDGVSRQPIPWQDSPAQNENGD